MRQPRRRGGGQRGGEAAVRQPPDPVAEHARGKAVRRHDYPGVLGRLREQRVADRREREVAERAAAVPALEAGAGEDELGPRRWIEALERREPVDAREAVPELPPPLGVEEVVGERPRVGVGEPERGQPTESTIALSRREGAP